MRGGEGRVNSITLRKETKTPGKKESSISPLKKKKKRERGRGVTFNTAAKKI